MQLTVQPTQHFTPIFFFYFHFPKDLVLVFVLFRIGQQILERFFLTGNEPCTYGTGLKLVRIFQSLEKVVPLSNNSLFENMCVSGKYWGSTVVAFCKIWFSKTQSNRYHHARGRSLYNINFSSVWKYGKWNFYWKMRFNCSGKKGQYMWSHKQVYTLARRRPVKSKLPLFAKKMFLFPPVDEYVHVQYAIE